VSHPESLLASLADAPGHADSTIVGSTADPRARQQAAIWALGRRAATRADLNLLKQDAVSLLSEILGGDLGGIAEITADGALEARITVVDADGRAVPLAASRLTLEPAASMAAFVMSDASAVISNNLVAERRFADLMLREQGVVSALAVPLPVDDKPFGALGVFCRAAHKFTRDDVCFAETIANLLSCAIARGRAEEQSRLGKSLADAVLESVAEMVFTLDAAGQVLGLNRAARKRTGYDSAELRGRSFAATLLRPNEVTDFQAVFHAIGDSSSRFCGVLLTKKHEPVFLEWQLQPVKIAGRPLCVVLTGREAHSNQPVQSFSASGTAADPKALRSSPRRSYQYRQRIAPMYTVAIPTARDFFEVECRDISAGGVSFYLEGEPDFTALVVGLGRAPDLAYFTARVARVSQESVNGKTRYLVGCRFTGRVHL
jgi:PAS domain S-box-containing protein